LLKETTGVFDVFVMRFVCKVNVSAEELKRC